MSSALIAGSATTIVAFALTLWLLLAARKRRIAREHRATQEADRIEVHNQLTNRLMSTKFDNRVGLAFMVCAMVNLGPVKLGVKEVETQTLVAFRNELAQIAYKLEQGTLDRLTEVKSNDHDELLNTLAASQEFMHFMLRSIPTINGFIDFYLDAGLTGEVYSREMRCTVRPHLTLAVECTEAELTPIYEQFVGPVEGK